MNTKSIAGTVSLPSSLQHTFRLGCTYVQAQSSLLYVCEPFARRVHLLLSEGVPQDFDLPQESLMRMFSTVHEIRMYTPGGNHLPGHARLEKALGYPIRSLAYIPLKVETWMNGAIVFVNPVQVDPHGLELLQNSLAGQMNLYQDYLEAEEKNSRLEDLLEAFGQISATLDPERLLRYMIENVCALLDAESSSLFLLDESTGEIVLDMVSNEQHRHSERLRIPAGKGIIGEVVKTGKTVIVNDAQKDVRHYEQVDEAANFVTQSILAVALRTRSITLGNEYEEVAERIIGGLEAVNKRNGQFNALDVSLLETFANQAATVLETARLYREANQLFLDVIQTIMAVVDAKDPYTQGHSQRVSRFSVAMGAELGLTPVEQRQLRIGSLLHDVGKIGIPDSILSKPEKLTEEEYQLIIRHPEIGASIIQQVHMLKKEINAIAEHHERVDGQGYPRRLKGEQISIDGRIVSVADAFDAMTSNRPYRDGMTAEDAFARLRTRADEQFDRNCIEALVNAYQNGTIRTQREELASGSSGI